MILRIALRQVSINKPQSLSSSNLPIAKDTLGFRCVCEVGGKPSKPYRNQNEAIVELSKQIDLYHRNWEEFAEPD